MKVVSYSSADAPEGQRGLAFIWALPASGKKAQRMPVLHFAVDEETARTQAAAWWEAEIKKRSERSNKPARGRPKKVVAAEADPEEESPGIDAAHPYEEEAKAFLDDEEPI